MTIPSSDMAFRAHVEQVLALQRHQRPDVLGSQLRRLFPRVLVKERELSGEPPTWYVYRDGAWRPDATAWWTQPNVPRVAFSQDGWIVDANPAARTFLGIGAPPRRSHFRDFAVPGTLEDAGVLFDIVKAGKTLDATVRLRPTSGEVIACELHGTRENRRPVVYFRLAADIPPHVLSGDQLPQLTCDPIDDAVFADYAHRTLAGLITPTPDELAIGLRRLYPHASVAVEADHWLVSRDRGPGGGKTTGWWADRTLPWVRYDEQGLILAANEAALDLIHPSLVGRHWHDFVTPGSTEEVSLVIAMIQEAGWAVSRFRMPSASGALVEFDSYTRVDGDLLTTVMRPIPG